MARLQILQLPKGDGDDRPPFILVIDEIADSETERLLASREVTDGLAKQIGARAVAAFHGMTVDIPANEVPVGPDGYPVRLRVEGDFEAFREQVEDEIHYAQGQVTRAVNTRAKDQETRAANEWIERLTAERDEARHWARHGYEIGQKHCGWTDHGTTPDWLTEGWPRSFESCEHLKQAVEFDEALTRVLNLPEQPQVMAAGKPPMEDYLHGYGVGVRAAKRAARNEPTRPAEGGD